MTSAIDVVYIIVIISLIIIPVVAGFAHSWFGLNDPTSPSSNVKDLSTFEINQKCRIVIKRWENPAKKEHLAKLAEKENKPKRMRRDPKPRAVPEKNKVDKNELPRPEGVVKPVKVKKPKKAISFEGDAIQESSLSVSALDQVVNDATSKDSNVEMKVDSDYDGNVASSLLVDKETTLMKLPPSPPQPITTATATRDFDSLDLDKGIEKEELVTSSENTEIDLDATDSPRGSQQPQEVVATISTNKHRGGTSLDDVSAIGARSSETEIYLTREHGADTSPTPMHRVGTSLDGVSAVGGQML
jgi:hypothetical protein